MERTDRGIKDDTQKAKLIFLTLAVLVTILLIWSFTSANKAKSERDAVRQEMEVLKQENAKLEQWLKDRTQENDELKKKIQQLRAKPKAKPAVKKKTKTTKTTTKKKTR
ncbi:MAG: hypothetical protein WC539_07990 [Nitrospirota bacterium]